jgi:hypothetical protein
MKKLLLLGVSFAAMAVAATSASAGDYPGQKKKVCDPYVNYGCLDAYLGDGFFERFINYYKLEWGHDGPPVDPKAPPGRRAGWPATPQTTPPYPFTEWPYGGTESLGVTRPNIGDSPLMNALSNTKVGEIMAAGNMQIYGWVNVGGNVSTNGTRPGGNFPISYTYTPNTVTLDQAVVYFERVPDTVQTDHVDWGFRLSAIYGENYRYTTSYGVMSYQLLNHNQTNGFDFPMMWGELFFPQTSVGGTLVRVGRYISIPDTEAQLAPNNYMYTHSMTYTFDNYTNEGVMTTTGITKNWFLTMGVSIGTEAAPWHLGQTLANPNPSILFPSNTFDIDPGAKPSFVMGVRWQSDNGYDTVYGVMDGINGGNWGYNNLQWTGGTWYHKFNDQFHFTWEAYTLSQSRVPNLNNSVVASVVNPNTYAQGEGLNVTTPFSGMPYNSPNAAHCGDSAAPWCTARSIATVMYWNYRYSAMDNFSFRPEFYDDEEGQRTGTRTRYLNWGLGWQHWFSPQIEVRPEVNYYHSINANAFNGNFDGNAFQQSGVVTPTKNYTWIGAIDAIIHF